jgi:hypothetical protein
MTTRKQLIYKKSKKSKKTRSKRGGVLTKSGIDTNKRKATKATRKTTKPNISIEIKETCGICLEHLNKSDNIPSLPCKHEFHKDCLVEWCKSQNNIAVKCPLCRGDIVDVCKDINPQPDYEDFAPQSPPGPPPLTMADLEPDTPPLTMADLEPDTPPLTMADLEPDTPPLTMADLELDAPTTHSFNDFGEEEDILRNGNVGDLVNFEPNNQQGVIYYKISLNDGEKYLEAIGDYQGYYDDPNYGMMGGKRTRTSRSKRGGDPDKKLAILLITTHGNLDGTDPETIHTENINVYKINATTPGVCNFVSDDELLDMGNSISKYINEKKTIWNEKNVLTSAQNLDLAFKTPRIGQQQITYLAQSLRTYLPRIDGVYKETVKTTASTKKRKLESDFFDDDDTDPDIGLFRENIGKGYKMYNWKQGDSYLNKTYTIIPEERIDTTSNPYNNTVLIIGEPGMPDLDIVNMSHNLRSGASKEDSDFTLSEILTELVEKGYTDTIIIDLSCSAGWDERDGRGLRRGTVERYGGKRRTKRVKAVKKTKKNKKSKRKTKRH